MHLLQLTVYPPRYRQHVPPQVLRDHARRRRPPHKENGAVPPLARRPPEFVQRSLQVQRVVPNQAVGHVRPARHHHRIRLHRRIFLLFPHRLAPHLFFQLSLPQTHARQSLQRIRARPALRHRHIHRAPVLFAQHTPVGHGSASLPFPQPVGYPALLKPGKVAVGQPLRVRTGFLRLTVPGGIRKVQFFSHHLPALPKGWNHAFVGRLRRRRRIPVTDRPTIMVVSQLFGPGQQGQDFPLRLHRF